jgi:hypothetical protein
MLRLLLDGELHPHGLKVRHHVGYPNTDAPMVLVVPGRYYAQHTDQISEAIQRFASVLMVVTSDEESCFDIGKIEHKAIRFWQQTPRVGREYPAARLFGVGFPPHLNRLSSDVPEKDVDVFLAAQNTHARRRECFEALENTAGSQFVHATEGFTQSWREGAGPGDYALQMMKAKVAPAPSGAVSPDSFRFFEALEAHCVPIADDVSPVDGPTGYWSRLFPDAPFPILTDYESLPGYIDDALKAWPANANRIAAYWMRYKRRMAHNLRDDLEALGAL